MIENSPRSSFVTVLAWVFIILSGLMSLGSVLQNIMIQALFRNPTIRQSLLDSQPHDLPPVVAAVTANMDWMFLLIPLVSIFALVSSIGLLRRLNWARRCFVGLMVLFIVWQLVALVIQFDVLGSAHEQFLPALAQGAPDMRPLLIAMGLVVSLAI